MNEYVHTGTGAQVRFMSQMPKQNSEADYRTKQTTLRPLR